MIGSALGTFGTIMIWSLYATTLTDPRDFMISAVFLAATTVFLLFVAFGISRLNTLWIRLLVIACVATPLAYGWGISALYYGCYFGPECI